MLKRTFSAVMAVTLALTMSFSVSGEVLAASEDTSVENSVDGLEVEVVDSLEAFDMDLEEKQAGE